MDDLFHLGISTLAATIRLATPLILCAMAGLLSERSGVIDIGLEGKMLAGAFAAAVVAAVTGSALLALLAGVMVAILLSLVHGVACITYRGDQVVSGVAINIVAAGMTVIGFVGGSHAGGSLATQLAAAGARAVISDMRALKGTVIDLRGW